MRWLLFRQAKQFLQRQLTLFCLLILTAFAPAYADHQNIWVLTNPEPPFVIQDDKRRLTGMLVDVVDGILAEAQIHQKVLAAPWDRVEREARTKSNVLVFALARTKEREAHYHWITPLTANVFAVYARQGTKDQFTQLDDLKALSSIAVLADDVRHKILRENGYPNIQPYDNWLEAFDSVNRGDSDAIFISDAGVRYFCTSLDINCGKLTRVFMYERMMSYLVLSKVDTNPILAQTLSEAAQVFKKSPEFNQLTAHWLTKYKNEPIAMHMEDGILNLWQK